MVGLDLSRWQVGISAGRSNVRRHPRLMAFIMWLVIAAITVAGFAAFEASHQPSPTETPSAVRDVLDIVGGVGRASAGRPVGTQPASTVPTLTPILATAPVATTVGLSAGTTQAPAPVPAEPSFVPPPEVERWRPIVLDFFSTAMVNRALEVMWCESRGDPGAVHPDSGAAGLFQHLPEFWSERSAAAGFAGADIHDPEANIAVAAWLVARDGWRHWVASEACWNT